MASDTHHPAGPVAFATTHWTRILASHSQNPGAKEALRDLCEAYYDPVVAVLRNEKRSDDEAREIAHAFFEQILERQAFDGADPALGRFRSYLLGALKHFLANHRLHTKRIRRGFGMPHLSIDAAEEDSTPIEIADNGADPAVFDRAWALKIIEHAFTAMSMEATASKSHSQFSALKPWLTGDGDGRTQAEAAAGMGLSEGAFRVALHRERRRFREMVKAEIAHTVSQPADVADELRHLIAALSGR